jgi:hypothetical protein
MEHPAYGHWRCGYNLAGSLPRLENPTPTHAANYFGVPHHGIELLYVSELMGITIGSQMSEYVPSHVDMISDSKGAVTRIDESMKLHHRALGHRA